MSYWQPLMQNDYKEFLKLQRHVRRLQKKLNDYKDTKEQQSIAKQLQGDGKMTNKRHKCTRQKENNYKQMKNPNESKKKKITTK